MKKTLVLLGTISSLIFASDVEQLVKDNCASCHLLTKPTKAQRATLKAPPMMGVMFHLKDELKDEQKIKEFIIDYVQNPTKEKAICLPQKIERFGLMPSMKGVLTETQLGKITSYLYNNFPPAQFQHQDTTKITQKAQSTPFSPFLITGKMPHLTKIVKQNWDNPSFRLTDTQKEKLLGVRKTTMVGIVKLKKKILLLEKEVSFATMSGEIPKNLKAKVDQIAKLRAEATMVHIRCILNTKNILDAKQLEYLLSSK